MSALWPTGSAEQPPLRDGFGPRPNGPAGALPFHYGVDVPMKLGAPIHAAVAGTVVKSGPQSTLGLVVVIDSPAGQFLYSHLAPGSLLPRGARVEQGGVVGRVGLTGLTTGPHTCFRTFAGSWLSTRNARNPVTFMAALNTPPPAITPASEITQLLEDTPMILLANKDVPMAWVVAGPGVWRPIPAGSAAQAVEAFGPVRKISHAAFDLARKVCLDEPYGG